MTRTPIIAGNWKMNKGTAAEARALIGEIVKEVGDVSGVDVIVCPPYTALATAQEALADCRIALGAQDVFWKPSGAFTGQVSAPMLAALGIQYVIIGHSEARGRFGVAEPDFNAAVLRHFGETDATVYLKAQAALAAGMTPIVCVGETLAEREAEETDEVIAVQVRDALAGMPAEDAIKIVFAYEPVWAIGTGRTCDSAEANRVCGHLRTLLEDLYDETTANAVRIQYGGSMKPENAAELLAQAHIDGGLIGGASLKAPDFAAIVQAASVVSN